MADASRPLPTWAPSAAIAVALAGLVALSFLQRWMILTESPFPVGVDGYFYPVQLRALLESGELQYPAAPLAFWLMAPLAALTDPIVGAKLGAALFGALVALPAYGVGARLGRSRGAGLIAAVLATTSAGSAFLTIEFVKNGVGLTVLLAAVWLLLRALESPTVVRVVAALAGGVLTILAHKMAAVLLVAIAVPAVLATAAERGMLRGRRLAYAIGVVVVAGTALVALGAVFPRQLPSLADLDLAGALLGDRARWSAPALVFPDGALTFGHEAMIGGILGGVGAFVSWPRPQRWLDAGVAHLPQMMVVARPPRVTGDTAVAWVVVGLALVIAWPYLDVTQTQGLGFRLRIAAFVPLALAAAVVAGRLLARIKHRDFILAAIALVLATRTPGHRREGRVVAHPAMVAAIHALAGEVPAGDTIIVPERHIVFMVAWYTRARVSLQPDRVPPARRWRLMPLAWIGMGSPLDAALRDARDQPQLRPPLGLHPRHPNGIVLVAEPTWRWVLDQLPPEPRARWERWPTI